MAGVLLLLPSGRASFSMCANLFFLAIAVLLSPSECYQVGAKPKLVLHNLPVLITYYDTSLCYDDAGNVVVNINCNEDPGHFADATDVTADSYGRVAACVPQWLGAIIEIPGVGSWRCRDTGGDIRVAWNRWHGRWVIHVDLLMHDPPPFNYWLFSEWRLS